MKPSHKVKIPEDGIPIFSDDFMTERKQLLLQERDSLQQEKNYPSLPDGWRWTTMGDIADIIGGGTPSTKVPEYFNDGIIPWLTPADLSGYNNKFISHGERFITEKGFKNSSARLVPTGTVLFTSRAPIGYVAIASNPLCTNQGFKSFVLRKGILPDYVYWYLKGSKDLAESVASGTTFLELSGSKAKQLPVPVAPLDVQKLIVAEIEIQFSRLDEAVTALKRIKANLKRYKASVLKAAVEGKLTEEWRKENCRGEAVPRPDIVNGKNRATHRIAPTETGADLLKRILAERRKKCEKEHPGKRYKEPAAPDTSNLPELPKGWVWASIEQLAEAIPNAIKAGPFGSSLKKSFYVPKGFKIYGQEQVLRDDPYYGDYYIDEERFRNLSSCAVKPGDILISLVGTIGRVLILPDDIESGIINPRLVKLSLDNRLIGAKFFKAYLQSPYVKYLFSLISHGGTMDILNLTILKEIPIPLPPLNEQNIIVEELERISSIEKELESAGEINIKRAERLRQSILKKAFSGRLVQ